MNSSVADAGAVARLVEESIHRVPAFDGMTLTVDVQGIIKTEVGGKDWWRVPVLVTPPPHRQSTLYEALAEVEGDLQDERGLDILLFPGN